MYLNRQHFDFTTPSLLDLKHLAYGDDHTSHFHMGHAHASVQRDSSKRTSASMVAELILNIIKTSVLKHKESKNTRSITAFWVSFVMTGCGLNYSVAKDLLLLKQELHLRSQDQLAVTDHGVGNTTSEGNPLWATDETHIYFFTI